MAKFHAHKFHTKWLIPEKTAIELRGIETEKGRIEHITLWQETHMSSHHFTEGDTCYHVDNYTQPMRIDKILRSFPKPRNGEKQKSRLEGISVHWYEHEIDFE